MENFITKIKINNVSHLKDIEINLPEDKRTHLILTGRNGSGKTSLLEALKSNLSAINNGSWSHYKKYLTDKVNIKIYDDLYKKYHSGVNISFNRENNLDKKFEDGNFVTAYFTANRQTSIDFAHGVEDIKFAGSYKFEQNPSQVLLKYMVHLKTQQAYAMLENKKQITENISAWFERFKTAIRNLIDDDTIDIVYEQKIYNFMIHQKGRAPFGLNELSDGYSSIIRIVSDLILRMDKNWLLKGQLTNCDIDGVVLIDELETHLHIELQRKILPFLTKFFPNIQFIVSTHSPYIVTSISNAVIYDLEKKVQFNDMSGYAIDIVAEGYFDADNYSIKIKEMTKRLKELLDKTNITAEEQVERAELCSKLEDVPGNLGLYIQSIIENIEWNGQNGKN